MTNNFRYDSGFALMMMVRMLLIGAAAVAFPILPNIRWGNGHIKQVTSPRDGYYQFGILTTSRDTMRWTLQQLSSTRDDELSPSHQDESPKSNLQCLQERYNFTSEWIEKHESHRIASMNQSVMIERIHWMQERLQLNDEDHKKIIRQAPLHLGSNPETKFRPQFDYLKERLAINDKKLAKLIRDSPSVLGGGIREGQRIQRNLNWLEKRLGLSDAKSLGNFVLRRPALLQLDVETNMDPTLNKIKDRLGLNETELVRFCMKNPQCLAMNYTTGIEPKLNWLQDRFDLDQTQLRKMLIRQPKLLQSSVQNTFEPNLAWLQGRVCVDDAALRKMIMQQPAILYYSPSMKMEPKLQWLCESLNLEDVGAARIVTQNARLFDFNIPNNLEPTLEFFKNCIGHDEAIQFVRQYPFYLGSSLEKRLKPRLKQVQELGIELDRNCLFRMCMNTNSTWDASVNYQAKRIATA